MSSFLHLPIELIYYISEYLEKFGELSSWSRSCRTFYSILNPILYRGIKDETDFLCWLCGEDRLGTVRLMLGAGSNPNVQWEQDRPVFLTLAEMPFAACFPSYELWHIKQIDVSAISQWMLSHADIDLEKAEYFEKYHYTGHVPCETGVVGKWSVDYRDQYDAWPYPYGIPIRAMPHRYYWTPLHMAVHQRDHKLLNLLLDHGADINGLSRLVCCCNVSPKPEVAPLWSPLHTSLCLGDESTAKLLLSRGASTDIVTRRRKAGSTRFTALHSACMLELADIACTLVEEGYQTDLEVRDHKGQTPLVYAFFKGNWTIIDLLLEKGADIDAKNGPLNALGHACMMGYYAEALRLLDLGATPERQSTGYCGRDGYFHLHAVAGAPKFPSPRSSSQEEFRLELVNRLIRYGMDVNQRAADGSTALMEAASFHRIGVVQILLHSGADVRAKQLVALGRGALEKAVSLASVESRKTPKGAMLGTVRVLLKAMADGPAPKVEDAKTVPGASKFDTIDDADIANAIRIMCCLPHTHEDKLEVLALLLRYKRAAEMAKTGRHLVYTSMMLRRFDISDLLLENGFSWPCKVHFRALIRQFHRIGNAEGLKYIVSRFPGVDPERYRESSEPAPLRCYLPWKKERC
ncbi:ankyrin repeat-containing domain protein [Xylaria nigripes]|nr:ankyrin repeat-containing domain protein [Xylaria nigripes]